MLPIISERDGNRIKIELTVDLSGSTLEAEESFRRSETGYINCEADGGWIGVQRKEDSRSACRDKRGSDTD